MVSDLHSRKMNGDTVSNFVDRILWRYVHNRRQNNQDGPRRSNLPENHRGSSHRQNSNFSSNPLANCDGHNLERRPQSGPRKATDPILNFVDVRTVQCARLSGRYRSAEIASHFNGLLSATTINGIRHSPKFDYQPSRHVRALTPDHMVDRVNLCRRILSGDSKSQLSFYFSDESRVVLGTDCQWV
jgi:hypothetical protein